MQLVKKIQNLKTHLLIFSCLWLLANVHLSQKYYKQLIYNRPTVIPLFLTVLSQIGLYFFTAYFSGTISLPITL
jgi:hypothetical protein